MNKQLAIANEDREIIGVLQTSLYPGASVEAVGMIVSYCRAAQLDPLLKPVHIVPIWNAEQKRMLDTVMPGIGLYRIQAARTGQYAGMTEPLYGPMVTRDLQGVSVTFPEWCQITVKRRLESGELAEFTAREYWLENYATKSKDTDAPNAMWRRRPMGQLAKCTEAQALRKAFPEVGNQSTAEEMEGKTGAPRDISEQVTREPAKPAELPFLPPAKFAKLLPQYRDGIESGKTTPAEILALLDSKYSLTADQREAVEALAVIEG